MIKMIKLKNYKLNYKKNHKIQNNQKEIQNFQINKNWRFKNNISKKLLKKIMKLITKIKKLITKTVYFLNIIVKLIRKKVKLKN